MNMWQFLHYNPCYATIILVAICLLVLTLITVAIIICARFGIIYKWYKEAKNEADFNSLSESIKRQLRKKRKTFVFASSVRDNSKAYKDIKELFDQEGEIKYVSESCIKEGFDKIFDKVAVVVYQVSSDDVNKSNPKHTDFDSKYQPIYKALEQHCSTQGKHCVLLTSEYVDIKSFDPVYTTTVNYYAKLRETLYILLHFTP